jgi:hypothetical protein
VGSHCGSLRRTRAWPRCEVNQNCGSEAKLPRRLRRAAKGENR